MNKLLAILPALAAVGCSASFDRAAMSEQLWEGEKVFTDLELARIEQLKPQLPSPFRLAVAPPLREDWHGPRLTETARPDVATWFEPLVTSGAVSEVIVLPRMLLGPVSGRPAADYYKAVRVAAARVQADAVLLLSTVTEVDDYANPLAILDWTGIGVCVFPGHHYDALTLVEGIVMDNRNEYIYWTGAAEGLGTTSGTLVGIDPADAVRESRRNALRSLAELLGKEAVRLKAGPPGPRYGTPGR
jgi:hypothetical protein